MANLPGRRSPVSPTKYGGLALTFQLLYIGGNLVIPFSAH